jgi:hypothetical protein
MQTSMTPRTIEATSKRWKAHMLIALGLIVLGVLAFVVGAHNGQGGLNIVVVAGLLIVLGCCWWLYARARAWWHNG